MKLKCTIIAFLLFQLGFSQDTKMSIREYINFSDLPAKSSETPSWAALFYTNPEQINVTKLKKEINDWVLLEKKERREQKAAHSSSQEKEPENELKEGISEIPIVRFAIDFIRKIPNSWIDESGYIVMPTKNDFLKNAENEEKTRTTTNKQAVVGNNWSQIGSIEIVKDNNQIVSSTNIFYISISPSSTNIRLASSQTGAQYKTTDGGANWNYLNNYTGPSAFHPTDANKIIVASNPIRLSTDGGTSWAMRPIFTTPNKIIWSGDGNTVVVATEQGIYVSSNASAGATFSQKQTGNFMDVDFKPGSSTIAYAITNTGAFYKTTDGGLTWILKPTSYTPNTNKNGFLVSVTAANPNLVSIACLTGASFDTDNAVELIKSTNSGESFAPLSITTINYSQGFYDFVFEIAPNDVNTYFFGVCSFYKSTDGGLNFTLIGGYGGNFGTHPDIQDMVVFNNTVVVATDGGVSESTDNFTNVSNWRSTCKGLNSLDYWGFDQGFNTDQMGGGKFHNGNNIYNPNWGNGKSLHIGGAEEADGKAIFSRPNSLNFSGPNYLPYYQMEKVFKLVDVDYNSTITNSYAFTMFNNQFYFGARNSDTTSNTTSSNIIYAGYNNDVVVSYNSGLSNQVLKNFDSRVWDIKTTRKDDKVIYVMTESSGLYKTIDGGLNWTLCNMTFNNINLMPNGLDCYIDVSQTNANEIWLIQNKEYTNERVFKSIDGGQVWTNLNTTALNDFQVKQIVHQYGSNGGVYLIGHISGIAKCYYRNNTMTDWTNYSSNLMPYTATARNVFLKASYFKEKLRVAGAMGIQEISFYEKSNPVAQPTTSVKEVCVNQEIKFNDYSILNYTGASWQWSFSKIPLYLNGTTASSRDPIVKFLSPGAVTATLKVTNSAGQSDTKTIANFINVNYDSASCLQDNSDFDYQIACVNNIAATTGIPVGGQKIVTNFNGATTGKFLVNLNLFTNCRSLTGNLIALINLDNDQINVIRYSHYEDGVLPISVTGNNTSTVYSASVRWAGISFSLINKALYLNHISNYCASIGETGRTIRLRASCWKPYSNTGIDFGDSSEMQKCNNQILQSVTVTNNTDLLVTDFANATTGLFYVNIDAFTACNSATNNLKAIVNLNTSTIHVLDYKHFESNTTSATLGNETSAVTSALTTNAQVNYFISNKKLYLKKIADPCGGVNFRLNASCWSAMDDDSNGIDNAIEPSNCDNALSTALLTDASSYLIQDFSSVRSQQASVFVKLNINSSCNSTNATVYLSVDLYTNLIHVISYKHFGAATFSTVVNNDSPNVYSESSTNGKLKFILINNALYIQRLSTPCAGSTYQVTNSCYSLASQQVLDVNKYVSSGLATVIAYPNPTKGIFNIDTKTNTDDFSLSFYSIDGKYITPIFEKTDTNILKVNMEQYAQGLYFVIVFDKLENKYNYLKIIKE